jgi:flagellar biogenesis protein FliO
VKPALLPALPAALRAHPRRALGVAAAACAATAAATSGEAGGTALRALAVVALLALGAYAVRARATQTAAPRALAVEDRQLLGRDAGVALVAAGGRRWLVGFAPSGVTLVAEVGAREDR